jgi:hypothetical protein
MKLLVTEDNVLFRGLLQQILASASSLLPNRPKLQPTSSIPRTIAHE